LILPERQLSVAARFKAADLNPNQYEKRHGQPETCPKFNSIKQVQKSSADENLAPLGLLLAGTLIALPFHLCANFGRRER
jgi:hypothetical protein